MNVFYLPDAQIGTISFPEEESKHIVKVLRMKEGDRFCVTNGKGSLFDAVLIDAHPKRAIADLSNQRNGYDTPRFNLTIAIAPTKLNERTVETNDETDSMEEGCLSLPGIHESVKRPTRIHVQYLDADFKEHDEWVEGFEARCMQHEFDHLEGKMFIDHLSALRKQMIKGKLNNMLKGNVRCSYKVKTVK